VITMRRRRRNGRIINPIRLLPGRHEELTPPTWSEVATALLP
jgi:hypothetical protein